MQVRNSFDFPPKVLYEIRYCNQDDFSVLVCGGKYKSDVVVDTVYKLVDPEFNCEKYSCMPKKLYFCKTAVVNSGLFVLGGLNHNEKFDKSVVKFSKKTKTWSSKVQLILDDNSLCCCVCSFQKKLYVFQEPGQCFVYNMKKDKWTEIADIIEYRYNAACSFFGGKIVVTGGKFTKSVEVYDYYENKWTYLPDMIEERSLHASVSMGNKLFVIGGFKNTSCEVFDSFSRKFLVPIQL